MSIRADIKRQIVRIIEWISFALVIVLLWGASRYFG